MSLPSSGMWIFGNALNGNLYDSEAKKNHLNQYKNCFLMKKAIYFFLLAYKIFFRQCCQLMIGRESLKMLSNFFCRSVASCTPNWTGPFSCRCSQCLAVIWNCLSSRTVTISAPISHSYCWRLIKSSFVSITNSIFCPRVK